MTRLLDGPAGPRDLLVPNAPMYVRIVVDPSGLVDALDAPGDVPRADETIHVYELVEGTQHGRAFVTLARPRRCVQVATGDYRYRPDVDGESVREAVAWRTWVHADAGSHPRWFGSRLSAEPSEGS